MARRGRDPFEVPVPDPAVESVLDIEAAAGSLLDWASAQFDLDGLQIWTSDDLGFHPRAVLGRPCDEVDRATARRSCLESASVLTGQRLVVPLALQDRRSGACLFALRQPVTPTAVAACQSRLHEVLPLLDAALQRQRLSRLSGSARQSDQLRSILALCHTLEHSPCKRAVLEQIHHQLKQLIYAENFFVVVLDEARQLLHFEYFVDQYDRDEDPIPFVQGALEGSLSAFIVAAGRVLRGSSVELLERAGHQDRLQDQHYGPRAHDWLGVPMLVAGEVLGAVVIQSYDPQISFADGDPSVLSMLAETLGAALHRRRVREALERTVRERTAQLEAAKQAAELALADLKAAQAHLVQAEKMASLGQLVAGVAHEANTPLGVALTANSHLHTQVQSIRSAFAAGQMQRTMLDEFISTAEQATGLVSRNLERAARLVQSFKQVSVDRTSDGRRIFQLDQFLTELIGSLVSLWKHRPVTVSVRCEPGLAMDSFPGALGQVLTNLVQNAVIHAFSADQTGSIRINCTQSAERTELSVRDDGVGIAPALTDKIFEPFFTTRRNQGGTGLGLHIVFNLVHQKLGGTIRVESQPGAGCCFVLNLPNSAPV